MAQIHPILIDIGHFERTIRHYVGIIVPRLMVVLDSVRVVIGDLAEDQLEIYVNLGQPFSLDIDWDM